MSFSSMKAALHSPLAFSSLLCLASAMFLDDTNWDMETYKKAMFVRFVGPACKQDCRSTAGDWHRLMDQYKDHSIAIVAEVDCHFSRGHGVCLRQGVTHYPSYKWGNYNHTTLHEYWGYKTFNHIAAFAKKIFQCSSLHPELCHETDRQAYEELLEKPVEEIEELIDEYQGQIDNAENLWKVEKEVLQEEYKAAQKLKGKVRARKVRDLHNRYLQWTQNKKQAMDELTAPFKEELHMLRAAKHALEVHDAHGQSKRAHDDLMTIARKMGKQADLSQYHPSEMVVADTSSHHDASHPLSKKWKDIMAQEYGEGTEL